MQEINSMVGHHFFEGGTKQIWNIHTSVISKILQNTIYYFKADTTLGHKSMGDIVN